MPIKNVATGEAPSASHINSIVNTTNALYSGQSTGKPQINKGFTNLESVVFLVNNKTGEDIEKGSIVGIEDFHNNDVDNTVQIKKLVFPDHYCNWGVTLDFIESNGTGRVMRAGIAKVDIDIIDNDDNCACIRNDELTARSCKVNGHMKILYKESGTGIKTCLCVFPFDIPLLMVAVDDYNDETKTIGISTIESDGTLGELGWIVDVQQNPVFPESGTWGGTYE